MPNKHRRTKIVATMGPSFDREGAVESLYHAGVDVFRANFSHGSHADHARRIQKIRQLSEANHREVAIFADLQGPKIRIARFKNNFVKLNAGDEFILDANLGVDEGDEKSVGLDYKELPQDLSKGDKLLLDDGRIVMVVRKILASKIFCIVEVGGKLSNNKGINRLGGGLSAKALTEKDKEDLKFATTLGVDYFAISFPRDAVDIEYAKYLIKEAGSTAGVIAKIERAEAVEPNNLDEIIKASDAVMVARGDLGVEIGDAQLPAVQKRIIQRARALDKPVITATQMMESMIHNQIPTRAEVFDVANAVLDNTDAVMLSAETATGDYPDMVVKAMSRICMGAEEQPEAYISGHRLESQFQKSDEAVAMATMYIANHANIRAIISLTESGSVPRWMSRIRTAIPIFALTRHLETERKMNLYRGVYPMHFDATQMAFKEIDKNVIAKLKGQGILKAQDIVIITKGDVIGVHGHTNSLKIHVVT
ncbi:MAG: pyruvate kinase [Gammaproteobacteria bacterium]|nr:pyruvate kinase [Gammaproteobacteria bacterium]